MAIIATKLAVFAATPNRVADQFNRVDDVNALNAVIRMSTSSQSIIRTGGESLQQTFQRSWGAGARVAPSTGLNTMNIPILTRPNLTVSSSRSCSFTCVDSDSGYVTVTPITYAINFCVKKADYRNNAVTELADLEMKWSTAKTELYNAMQDDIITFLETNKSTVIAGATDLGYTVSGDALQVSLAQRARSFGDFPVLAEFNNFRLKPYQFIGHTFIKRDVNFYLNQGGGNSTNYSYQFDGQTEFHYTNSITNGVGVFATAYYMEPSTVGVVFRIPPAYKEGYETGDGFIYETEFLPEIGQDAALLYKSTCVNGEDIVEQYKLSIDMAIVSQYTDTNDTRSTGIWKIEFLTT